MDTSCLHTKRHLIRRTCARRCLPGVWLALAVTGIPVAVTAQQSADTQHRAALQQAYQAKVQPLLKRYCHSCHAGDRIEAEIDLEMFSTIDAVQKQPKIWQRIRRMLESRQMPPKDAPQPTDKESNELRNWVREYLVHQAKALAGDPGPVVLRRLNNAEYAYTIRDLTGIETLNPTRDFPVDGAAGEGFTNAGSAQGMSPALVQKYLQAGKQVADHLVLLPTGIGFSPHTTRRDRTDALIASLRAFYQPFTDASDGAAATGQAVRFDTRQGGRFPVEQYLAATLAEREALRSGRKSIDAVARERHLNSRYLKRLWKVLSASNRNIPSIALDQIRATWDAASPEEVVDVVRQVARWQAALWTYNSIGHIERVGGPKAWLQPNSRTAPQQEFQLKLPDRITGDTITVYLSGTDAGDGNEHDFAVWENPRLAGKDRPDLALRHVVGIQERLLQLKQEMLAHTTSYLAAASAALDRKPDDPQPDLTDLAAKHKIDATALKAWLGYLAIRVAEPVQVTGHFTRKMVKSGDYDFVKGWGSTATPSVIANASDQEVRVPGIVRPRSVYVHPSPTLFAAVGWQSPISGEVRVEARLADAHPECGNGQQWFVQHRSRSAVGTLAKGDFGTRGSATLPAQTITVNKGELVSLLVAPRDHNHACDLTEVQLVITETRAPQRVWNLTADVSGDILAANPHADSHGHDGTWHFYKGPVAEIDSTAPPLAVIPANSLLATWRSSPADRRTELAGKIQTLVTGKPPADDKAPDALLYQQIRALAVTPDRIDLLPDVRVDDRFGKHPLGHAVKPADLVVQAPQMVAFEIPAQLAAGRTLIVTGHLDPQHGQEGSVQLTVSTQPPSSDLAPEHPILIHTGSQAQQRVEAKFAAFRALFPASLCYSRVVPVDEVVTLTLFYREDQHLQRLMLDPAQIAELDRLWDELLFVSQEPLAYQVAFEQIREFATQDRPDLVKAWAPLVKGVEARVAAFRTRLVETESIHLQSLLEFADRAWRRPLTTAEREAIASLYRQLRTAELPHPQALRLTLARLLTSPAFLYKREQPGPGTEPGPVSDYELATRLSYFLWSAGPDASLRRAAQAGRLTDSQELLAQTRRMLADDRIRRLAIHFACQWLHLRGFDEEAQKNEKLYPDFGTLRSAMYEETVLFFEDMFRQDGSILDLLDADHTFVNEPLAKYYGIDGVQGPTWRRIEGMRARGRGGLLGMATLLSSQSGVSRTSPILRGNWVYETLLGERLPRPPANVPVLPESVPDGLTARQLIEQHSSVAACAKCHARIDPFGFALEQFDTVGRRRSDPVDTATTLFNGTRIDGLDGLRSYLAEQRRDDVVRQFCRKLLGYALGREIQLSDESLLTDMQDILKARDFRFSAAVEAIVTSRPFRKIRGRESIPE